MSADVDECMNDDVCPRGHECVDNIGSYICVRGQGKTRTRSRPRTRPRSTRPHTRTRTRPHTHTRTRPQTKGRKTGTK